MENHKEQEFKSCNIKAFILNKRNVFSIIFIIIVFFAILLLIKYYFYNLNSGKYPKTIVVNGKSEIYTNRDIAKISFSIRESEKNKNIKEIQDKVAEKISNINSKLKELSILNTDIETVNYNIYPKYEYQTCISPLNANQTTTSCVSKNILIGYEILQTNNIKIRNLDNLAKVLNILAEENITEVTGPDFSVDNIEKYKTEAKLKAIEDAKTQAKILEKGLGIKLRKIVNFSDNSQYNNDYPTAYSTLNFKSAAYDNLEGQVNKNVEINQGEEKIISNVSLTFEVR